MILILPVIILTVITFLGLWVYDLRDAFKSDKHFSFKTQPIFRYTIYSVALIVGSICFSNSEIFSGILSSFKWLIYPFSIFISLIISALWFQHINKLDIYEPEKYKHLLAVFGVGALCTFGVYPLSYAFEWGLIQDFNGEFVNDILYSIVGIGMIEEFVKILPVIILARYTKLLNQPFDYLLFGTMSALGFAFIENSIYLFQSDLTAIDGRALYASPAHMILTSYICYQWSVAKFNNQDKILVKVFVAYMVSSVAHGLYDFWLISSAAFGLSIISILILLLGLKVWVRLANNLMNISNFYDNSVRFNANFYKYGLSVLLIAVLSFTYFSKALLYDSKSANSLLFDSVFHYSFLMAYIGINFSNIVVIKNYVAPLTEDFSFSLGMFLPLGINKKSCTGSRVKLFLTEYMRLSELGDKLYDQLPMKGKIVQRIVVDQDITYYIFKPDASIILPGVNNEYYAITNLDTDIPLCSKKSVMAKLYGLRSGVDFDKPEFGKKELRHIQNVRCRGVFLKK